MDRHSMLEASLLLHRDSLNQLRGLHHADAFSGYFVSDAFVQFLDLDLRFAVRTLSRYYGIPQRLIDGPAVLEFIKDVEGRQLINRYRRAEGGEQQDMYREFSSLHETEWITQIVFEEWDFLTTQSWLYAKVRKAFDSMIEAGGTAVEVSKRRMDQAIRSTVKKDPALEVTAKDGVRAIAKWVAVGGSPAASLIGPVTGVLVSAAAGMFLLYDPPSVN
jgi:hypothetical protein